MLASGRVALGAVVGAGLGQGLVGLVVEVPGAVVGREDPGDGSLGEAL